MLLVALALDSLPLDPPMSEYIAWGVRDGPSS